MREPCQGAVWVPDARLHVQNQPYTPNEVIRIKRLRALDLFSKRELISQTFETAVGELALTNSLNKVGGGPPRSAVGHGAEMRLRS